MVPLFVIAAAAGGAAVYFYDPELGRRRRARLRDQAARAQSNVRHTLDAGKRDLVNRAEVIKGRARAWFSPRKGTDDVLAQRVRSKMGRYVAHPSAIEVSADAGEVTLTGSILAHEHDDLIEAVSQVPGVRDVLDRLSIYETAEGISELQGGRDRRSPRSSVQASWAPATRVAACAAGTTLALYALRGGFRGLLFGTAGALLVLRSTTNKPLRTLAGKSEDGAVDIQKTLQINAPIDQVFEYLANYENFPQFMRNVRSVDTQADGRSHWVVAGPAGSSVEFDSYLTELEPNSLIAWSSVEGSPVRTSGTIRFASENEGTRVHIRMSYSPPAGVLGHVVAKLFGADPKAELDQDLLRLKSMLETGKTPRDAAAGRSERTRPQSSNTGQPA